MILGNTDIDIMTVRNILGYPSTDLGTLCSCDNVNKYSRYRPGYWATDGSKTLVFKKPLGGNYSDPRGTDTEIGSNLQLYKLGDFRGYNSTARQPWVDGDNPRITNLASTYTDPTYDEDVALNIGEVDWFNEETKYWGKNASLGGCNQVVAVDSNGTVLGYVNKDNLRRDGRNLSADFTIAVKTPTSSATQTTIVKFGLGKANKLYYYFPTESNLVIQTTKVSAPTYTIFMDESCSSTIYNRISRYLSESDTDVYDVILSPQNGTFITGSTTLAFKTTSSIIVAYPSFNEYTIISPKLTLYYTVIVTNNNTGSVINTWTGNGTFAFAGHGLYNLSFPLNTKALDGYHYDIKITDIGSTTQLILNEQN